MSCHTTGILAAVWREIFAPILTEIIQRLASLFRCESKIDILGDVERRKLYKLEILIRCASKTRDIVGPYSILWYLFFDQWEDLHLVDLHIATKIWLWDEMKKLSYDFLFTIKCAYVTHLSCKQHRMSALFVDVSTASSMENACRVWIEPSERTSILIDSVEANVCWEKKKQLSIRNFWKKKILNDIQVRERASVYSFSPICVRPSSPHTRMSVVKENFKDYFYRKFALISNLFFLHYIGKAPAKYE